MAEAKKDEKPKVDFDSIGAKLKEHAKGEHINDLTERLNDIYSAHKKSVGNKRKLDTTQAEQLGHQLYDELANYLAEYYYSMKPDEVKLLKGKKGKHGDSALDSLVEHAFDLDRTQLINSLKKAADSGKSFSQKYIQEMMSQSIDKYNNSLQGKIIKNLNEDHIDDLRKQVETYISKHKLDPDDFKGALKSKNFREVLGAYASLASNYYKKEEAPKPK